MISIKLNIYLCKLKRNYIWIYISTRVENNIIEYSVRKLPKMANVWLHFLQERNKFKYDNDHGVNYAQIWIKCFNETLNCWLFLLTKIIDIWIY